MRASTETRSRLDGVVYSKGLGTTAYSSLTYAIPAGCTAFSATVGVDDEIAKGSGAVTFEVLADGTVLTTSPVQISGSPALTGLRETERPEEPQPCGEFRNHQSALVAGNGSCRLGKRGIHLHPVIAPCRIEANEGGWIVIRIQPS